MTDKKTSDHINVPGDTPFDPKEQFDKQKLRYRQEGFLVNSLTNKIHSVLLEIEIIRKNLDKWHEKHDISSRDLKARANIKIKEHELEILKLEYKRDLASWEQHAIYERMKDLSDMTDKIKPSDFNPKQGE